MEKYIEVAKIKIKEIDTASEEYPKTNVEDENIIDMEDISMCEDMSETSTVNSKEDEDIVIDKVIEENNNIREVLDSSKEPYGNEVKEKADIIEAEGETKVGVEEDLKNTSQG